jgi:signal transduction histidine kinase
MIRRRRRNGFRQQSESSVACRSSPIRLFAFTSSRAVPKRSLGEQLIDSVVSIFQSRVVNAHVHVEERQRADQPVRCFERRNPAGAQQSCWQRNRRHAAAWGGRLLLPSRVGRDWTTGRTGLVITVADTGSGMSGSVTSRTFEPFYTTKGIGGTGLGLWVSSEIVQRHNGTLLFRSSEKKGIHGTVFTLSFRSMP